MRNAVPAMVCIVLMGIGTQAAGQQPAPSDLRTRADAAQGAERVTLSLDYARQQLELANKLYSDGNVEKAEGAIGEVLDIFGTCYVRPQPPPTKSSSRRKLTSGSCRTACEILGSR